MWIPPPAGGACGYGTLVDVVPMKARVGAVSPVLFKSGEGCGACYKVRCLDHGICSRRAVTVIVTDECPGGVCGGGRTHFDLSGAAFGRLAVAGAGGQLRDRGEINVVFRRYVRHGGRLPPATKLVLRHAVKCKSTPAAARGCGQPYVSGELLTCAPACVRRY
jgi:hypothetical protein